MCRKNRLLLPTLVPLLFYALLLLLSPQFLNVAFGVFIIRWNTVACADFEVFALLLVCVPLDLPQPGKVTAQITMMGRTEVEPWECSTIHDTRTPRERNVWQN
jgi:hypothetical protein